MRDSLEGKFLTSTKRGKTFMSTGLKDLRKNEK